MDIRYYLVKNGTDTAAKAPYTIRVVPNGVANLNDLVSEILTRISFSEQRVRMVVTEATKVMLKHVLAGETVDFGGIRFKAQIPGSMDYEDSPFTPGADEVIVCAYADDELRDTFDGIVPVRLSAEEVAASIRVSNIMDVETERFGEIRGTAPFKVLGNGITLDAEGESAKLLDKKTGAVLATAEVVTVSKGQRATCRFGATEGGIAKGQYVLEVTTFGLVGETTPRVFRKPVTLVEAIPAPVEPVWKYSDELYVQTMTPRTGSSFKVGEPIDLTGRGLTDNETAPLYLGNLKANFGETSCDVTAAYGDDGTSGSWTIGDDEGLEPGTHEGSLEIWVIEGGSPNVKMLPLTVVKEA